MPRRWTEFGRGKRRIVAGVDPALVPPFCSKLKQTEALSIEPWLDRWRYHPKEANLASTLVDVLAAKYLRSNLL
jgi:hypothetical protein